MESIFILYLLTATTDSMDLLCQSSSVQVADSLHEQFELMGNVNFEQEENGVALATGLLRQFFLDLSDGLIPTRLNQNFFKAVQGKCCIIFA